MDLRLCHRCHGRSRNGFILFLSEVGFVLRPGSCTDGYEYSCKRKHYQRRGFHLMSSGTTRLYFYILDIREPTYLRTGEKSTGPHCEIPKIVGVKRGAIVVGEDGSTVPRFRRSHEIKLCANPAGLIRPKRRDMIGDVWGAKW
jgi:hypothetical protein